MVELDLSKLPEGTPKIAGNEVKWEKDTEAYRVDQVRARPRTSTRTRSSGSRTRRWPAYQALKLRDYGRIDMRLTKEGEVYVIEANPNPWLSSGAEFAMAATQGRADLHRS